MKKQSMKKFKVSGNGYKGAYRLAGEESGGGDMQASLNLRDLPNYQSKTVEFAARGSERMPGVILTVQSGLFEDGRQFALASGTTVSREEDLRVLREHAEAVANDAARPLFDPVQHAHDKVLDDEYQKLLGDRDEGELGFKRSHATLVQRNDEAARTRAKVPAAPNDSSMSLKTAAIAALAATIAPAAHDFLWTMNDEFVSWSLSMLTGAVFGTLITLLI